MNSSHDITTPAVAATSKNDGADWARILDAEKLLGDCRIQANAMFVMCDYFFGGQEVAHQGDDTFAIETTDATMLFEQAFALRGSTTAAGEAFQFAIEPLSVPAAPKSAKSGASDATREDPLLEFIREWDAGMRRYVDLSNDECDEYYARTVQPLAIRAARGEMPEANSVAGAAAALRHLIEYRFLDDLEANLVCAALTYLEGQAAS